MKVAAPKGTMLRDWMELAVRIKQLKRAFRKSLVPGAGIGGDDGR